MNAKLFVFTVISISIIIGANSCYKAYLENRLQIIQEKLRAEETLLLMCYRLDMMKECKLGLEKSE